MREYWAAELGRTTAYDRKELIWRLASPSVVPGRLHFGDPRSVEIDGGSAWGPGVVVWYHPVTIIDRDGRRHAWLLVTVQEKPGQSERMADLLPQANAGTLQATISKTSTIGAVRAVERYFQSLKAGRLKQVAALLAPQSGMVPDSALASASKVQFHGGTLNRVGRVVFCELTFSADVQYLSNATRPSGPNTYFFTVSNLNGPWQILSEGSGP